MHFFSGSFEDAGPVRERVSALFAAAGVRTNAIDGLQLMPMGKFQPVSLTLEDVTVFPEEHIAEKALIVNFTGFHDFYCTFLAETLEKAGTACRIRFVRLPEMEHLRTSPSEMRSVNIARVMDEYWEKAVSDIRILLGDEDLIILPQVFGLKDASVLDKIRTALPARVAFVGTMPPSVPGIRTQMLLASSPASPPGTWTRPGSSPTTSSSLPAATSPKASQRRPRRCTSLCSAWTSTIPWNGRTGMTRTSSRSSRSWTSASRRTRRCMPSRTANR